MLKRISLLKYVGRFYDVQQAGIWYGKDSIIYGHNGCGKSTLVAVLKSLIDGNVNLIKEKKSFDVTGQQKIEIHFEEESKDNCYIFDNGIWNRIHSNIVVFDEDFISNNIYDSGTVDDKNKANLHRIIVGEKGKLIAEKIKETEVKITKTEGIKAQKLNTYSTSGFKNILSIDEFIKLIEDEEIDVRISKIESEIAFAKQLEKPKELTFRMPSFSALKAVFQKNFKSSHETAEKKVKEHISNCWDNSNYSVSFLKEGLAFMNKQKNQCPFCGQSLLNVEELIKNYQIYFDDEYSKLQKEIEETTLKFKKWNIENYLTNLLSEAKEWSKYIGGKSYEALLSYVSSIKSELISSKIKMEEEFVKKQSNVNYQVDFSELVNLENIWETLGAEVTKFNKVIKSFIEGSKSKNLKDLEKQKLLLNAQKSRYQPAWKEFVEKYKSDLTTLDDLKKTRTKLLKSLADYSLEVFKNHQEKINETLEKMNTDFRIKNLSEKKDLRKSDSVFCGFEIEFFGKHIVKADNDLQFGEPNFKNTLSKGDKGALAFAFFLSMLSQDTELGKKVLIFDDPMSSFDEERELSTVHLLADIKNAEGKTPEQKIIFTHDKTFLIKLYDEENFAKAKYIKIVPDGVEDKHGNMLSKFEDLDVFEEHIKELTFIYLEQMNGYINGNTSIPINIHDNFRILLEAAFKAKY